jgi:hypothetical protein
MGRERYGVRSTEMEYREGRRSYGGREREIASVEEGANSCHQQTEAAPLSTYPAQRGSSEGVVLLRTPYSVQFVGSRSPSSLRCPRAINATASKHSPLLIGFMESTRLHPVSATTGRPIHFLAQAVASGH